MSQTVLVYASGRERKRLSRQGYQFLAEYEDYVLTRASGEQVEQPGQDHHQAAAAQFRGHLGLES